MKFNYRPNITGKASAKLAAMKQKLQQSKSDLQDKQPAPSAIDTSNFLKKRWGILLLAVVAMLVSGIIYAWSILKSPLLNELGMDGSALALNYTLLMSFFCLGIICGGFMVKKLSPRFNLTLSALMLAVGFFITSRLTGRSTFMLYFGYAFLAGGGIGIAYNTIITAVGAWFPDRKGVASGVMMVGFGFSTLILGNLAGRLFEMPHFGWRNTYLMLAILGFLVLIIFSRLLRLPSADMIFPAPKAMKTGSAKKENIKPLEISTGQMLRRKTFWKLYLYTVFLHTIGMTVIGFAKDLFMTLGSPAEAAVTLVGLISVCNGLIRLIIGWMLDNLGRRFSMLFVTGISILAPVLIIAGLIGQSLPLGVVGACLAAASYGCLPPIEVVMMRTFYGEKNFSSNFGVIGSCIIPASFMPTISHSLIAGSGSYVSTFLILIGFGVLSLYFALTTRRP